MNQRAESGRLARVWDLPVRLFHWSLLPLLVVAWVTGELGVDWMTVHQWTGYVLLTLALFRVAWGFVGSETARFARFLRGPRAVLADLVGRMPHGIGHNPAGGWMVVVVLALLVTQPATGLFATDDILVEGPLAAKVSEPVREAMTTAHHYIFDALLIVVGLHVVAILFYRFVRHEDLVTPMVNGWRALVRGETAPMLAGPGRALLVLALAATVVVVIVNS